MRIVMRIVGTAAFIAAGTTSAWWGLPSARAQSLDPLVADPQHYNLELENQWVRVIRERMKPHDTMPVHQHPLPGAVIISLMDRHNRLTAPDGTSRELRDHAGDLGWSPASTHRSENLDNAPFEGFQIEPKVPAGGIPSVSAPPEKMDAPLIDPVHYHVELDNEYVRVIRVKMAPHEKLALHKHPNTGAVLVHITEQNFVTKLSDGTVHENKYPAKMVRWVDPGVAHQDENLSDAPLEFIRVELKFAVGKLSASR